MPMGLRRSSRARSGWVKLLLAISLSALLLAGGLNLILAGRDPGSAGPQVAPVLASVPETKDAGLWDGPVLFHDPADLPLDLVMVDKSTQKLHLYRYDGRYHLVKTYACSTGEQQGQKRQEKDEKTPEGIYFNTKSFRDTKVTVFGDRAFGLNYPDPFDDLAGNTGSGIFIHGSDRSIKPFNSNGCVVMDNDDLADLDQRIAFDRTPIIIAEKLPYRFAPGARSLAGLVAILRQAMVPATGQQQPHRVESVTVLGFANHMVALGRVGIQTDPPQQALSRIYLAGADPQLVVLLKREWSQIAAQPAKVAAEPSRTRPSKDHAGVAMAPAPRLPATEKAKAEPAAKPPPAVTPEPAAEAGKVRNMVETWRRAWEQKKLADYIACYHPGFTADGRNLSQWRKYKDELNQRYKYIRIGIQDLKVTVDGESARAYFEQHYSSDVFRSRAFKMIELRKKGDDWKIYREITHTNKPGNWPG